MPTQNCANTGKRINSLGKVYIRATIYPDIEYYILQAGENSVSKGLERIIRFCIDNIPVEEFIDE